MIGEILIVVGGCAAAGAAIAVGVWTFLSTAKRLGLRVDEDAL